VESEEAMNTPRRGIATSLLPGSKRFMRMPSVATDQRTSGSSLEPLHRYLERLAGSAFYGKVTVSFQHGKVHDIKVEQTKKLDEL
jgi:hypothetical protein